MTPETLDESIARIRNSIAYTEAGWLPLCREGALEQIKWGNALGETALVEYWTQQLQAYEFLMNEKNPRPQQMDFMTLLPASNERLLGRCKHLLA